jgi:hypothetical protein
VGQLRRRMLLPPVIVVAAARGFGSTVRVEGIELYQGLVRAFRRWGKSYELRCGQLYVRTIVAFADRRYAYGAGEIRHLVHTCLAP